MASDTDTRRPDTLEDTSTGDQTDEELSSPLSRRHRAFAWLLELWPFSSLTGRIVSLNVFALAILAGGVLSLNQFQASLVEAKINSLMTQGQIIADAIGESSTTGPVNTQIIPDEAASILARLAVPTEMRARLFSPRGLLIADTRDLRPGIVETFQLPAPEDSSWFTDFIAWVYDGLADLTTGGQDYPIYIETGQQTATDFVEAAQALRGYAASEIRSDGDGGLVVSVAVPVQRFRQVVGALLLTTETSDIEILIQQERLLIVQVSLIALVVAVLLSFVAAGTMARPVHQLAEAADKVRRGVGKRVTIPDFTGRSDEIGDLSAALGSMTEALYDRIEATEAFAADVAHELKNPLSSLRSAVEAAGRVTDPDQQRRLMEIILKDVERLDRLISDISDASRLDAELARVEPEELNLAELVTTIVTFYIDSAAADAPDIELEVGDTDVPVNGSGERLSQVVRNLIDNALSFSPRDGAIHVRVASEDGEAVIAVSDEGPGIPGSGVENIFERFYTDRPEAEPFGDHSGLGLSISRQIVEAHGGTIVAANLKEERGDASGAIFTVRLPLRSA